VWAWGPVEWRFIPYVEELDELVSNVLLVPFSRQRVVLVRLRSGHLTFPGGTLEPGEHWVSTALREAREEAGLRLRDLHPFGMFLCRQPQRYREHLPHPEARRVVAWSEAWVDGEPLSLPGAEDVAEVLLVAPDEAASLLTADGRPEQAELGLMAAAERPRLSDEAFFRDNRLLLEHAYLSQSDPYAQSGKSGGAAGWELARRFTAGAIHRDGTFLDLGCANGMLMESMVEWALHDRGRELQPYGLDISEALVRLARRRLPLWSDRIWVGNAWDWTPPRRFDFVHALPELVPDRLRGRWLGRLLSEFLEPGGRLLLRWGDPHPPDPDRRRLRDVLAGAGFEPDGELVQERPAEPAVRVAWLTKKSPSPLAGEMAPPGAGGGRPPSSA